MTTEHLKKRGYKVSFIHFDNPKRQKESEELFLANDPEVSLPYLIKSQVYTIPSPRAEKKLKNSLKKLNPDIVHASLTLSPLDFRLPEICQQMKVPLIATFHPAFDSKLRNLTANTQQLTYQLYAPSLAKYDKVIVFSDMQINADTYGANYDDTLHDKVKKMYESAGLNSKYKTPFEPPHIVFWNLRQTSGFPTTSTEKNVTMVSGYSDTILNAFLDKGIGGLQKFTPYNMFMEIVNSDNYNMMSQYFNQYFIPV